MTKDLQNCRHWIFDMDGTLTLAMHDFDAIRNQLGLSGNQPILETITALPNADAQRLHRQLSKIELGLAKKAVAAPGAEHLLKNLSESGAQLGIVTRNSFENTLVTLASCGLDRYFQKNHIIARDHAEPKPSPQGIKILVALWRTTACATVMVGDYQFDLEAGQSAGTKTIYIDASGQFEFAAKADYCITHLDEIMRHWDQQAITMKNA